MIEYRLYEGPNQEGALKRIKELMKSQKMVRTEVGMILACPHQSTTLDTKGVKRLAFARAIRVSVEAQQTPIDMLRVVYDVPDEVLSNRDLLS